MESPTLALFLSGGREGHRDPPVRFSKVPLPKMSFPSGVLVGTTILSATDQPSSVWTSASASATCHSALGRHRARVRDVSPWAQPRAPSSPGLCPSAGMASCSVCRALEKAPRDTALLFQAQTARRGGQGQGDAMTGPPYVGTGGLAANGTSALERRQDNV